MSCEIKLHFEYYTPCHNDLTDDQQTCLQRRQEKLESLMSEAGQTGDDAMWQARTYPVLAVLAPVMSTSEGKIEFPGDPMSLYAALSYAVEQVVLARKTGLRTGSPYNDLCPAWGHLPSAEYRRNVDDNGIRQYDAPILNTDQTVFDPRVWNTEVEEYFVHHVLDKMRPKVVLISAVSPAHRYAIEIARTVRRRLPDCILVLGGRHADETMHYDLAAGRLNLEPSSTIRAIQNSRLERVFDFILAGPGYYTLDLLMKAISLAMDFPSKTARLEDVIEILTRFAPSFGPIAGQGVLAAIGRQEIHAWPVRGPRLNLAELPSPYRAFAIRARFPIFEKHNVIARTAHFMVTNACPYHCYFCSEGASVVGGFNSFKAEAVRKAVERVLEYISYGAEAIFFDDSIFWGGNVGHIVNFCEAWIIMRKQALASEDQFITVFGYLVERQKVVELEWGAQLTVDFLASRRVPGEAKFVLDLMRSAGCNYIYIGIESMANAVIEKVHKNINRKQTWDDRVRVALGMAHEAGIRIGSSVLFGLDGDTKASMDETIEKVEELLDEGLLAIASPNILTYHPDTEITHLHRMEDRLDYISPNLDNRPPYVYFEEAFPAVVSKNLSEADIWYIHEQTRLRWGRKRNLNPMPAVQLRNET